MWHNADGPSKPQARPSTTTRADFDDAPLNFSGKHQIEPNYIVTWVYTLWRPMDHRTDTRAAAHSALSSLGENGTRAGDGKSIHVGGGPHAAAHGPHSHHLCCRARHQRTLHMPLYGTDSAIKPRVRRGKCDTRLHTPLPPLLQSSVKSARLACRFMRAAVSNLRMGGAVAFVAAQGWMTGVSWSTRECSNGTVVCVAPVLGHRAATAPIRR